MFALKLLQILGRGIPLLDQGTGASDNPKIALYCVADGVDVDVDVAGRWDVERVSNEQVTSSIQLFQQVASHRLGRRVSLFYPSFLPW